VSWQQYKALIEGHNAHVWQWYTAVIIWKTQTPWPALRGFMYDWYGEVTGGYFGVKRACEPVHIQVNPAPPLQHSRDAEIESANFTVSVVNTAFVPLERVTAVLEWRTLSGAVVASRTWNVVGFALFNDILLFPRHMFDGLE
jgi:hypothetical protein